MVSGSRISFCLVPVLSPLIYCYLTEIEWETLFQNEYLVILFHNETDEIKSVLIIFLLFETGFL